MSTDKPHLRWRYLLLAGWWYAHVEGRVFSGTVIDTPADETWLLQRFFPEQAQLLR